MTIATLAKRLVYAGYAAEQALELAKRTYRRDPKGRFSTMSARSNRSVSRGTQLSTRGKMTGAKGALLSDIKFLRGAIGTKDEKWARQSVASSLRQYRKERAAAKKPTAVPKKPVAAPPKRTYGQLEREAYNLQNAQYIRYERKGKDVPARERAKLKAIEDQMQQALDNDD